MNLPNHKWKHQNNYRLTSNSLKVKSRKVKHETHTPTIYDPPDSFPQRLKKDKLENQLSKFLSIFK